MFVLKILLEVHSEVGPLKYNNLKSARFANQMIPDQFTLFPGGENLYIREFAKVFQDKINNIT